MISVQLLFKYWRSQKALSKFIIKLDVQLLLDFSLTVKAAPHACVIRTSQP